jgi:hypothetical protein
MTHQIVGQRHLLRKRGNEVQDNYRMNTRSDPGTYASGTF